MTAEELETQQVVVRIAERLFGIAIDRVQEMLELPALTAIPHVPERYRGVINLRGRVVPVTDLRVSLGLKSLANELDATCAMLNTRLEETLTWLDELESSVHESRAFSGETDPHKCAFGRWYDSFESPNRQVMVFLERFDQLYGSIHAIASKITGLVQSGDLEAARRVIAQAKAREFTVLKQLFAQLQNMIKTSMREVAVLLEEDGKEFAISVDEVVSVENLLQVDDEHAVLDSPGMGGLARGIAKRANDDLVLLLRIGSLAAGLETNTALEAV